VDSRHDYLETTHIARLARSDSEVMKGIGILGMVFLPGTFVSVSRKVLIPRTLFGRRLTIWSGDFQHELLRSYREPGEWTRTMDSVKQVLALLGSGATSDCAYTGIVVLLATLDEERTVGRQK
jgi:hypothetical protein